MLGVSRRQPKKRKQKRKSCNMVANMIKPDRNAISIFILDVIDIILCLPASSAECERGFSLMKLLKTDQWNKMSTHSVSHVMRIKLESASIEDFDPTPAIHLWNSDGVRRRRPYYMDSPHYNDRVELLAEAQENAAGAAVNSVTMDMCDSDSDDSTLESDLCSESDMQTGTESD